MSQGTIALQVLVRRTELPGGKKNFQIIEMIINCFENYRHRYDYYGNKGGVAATRAVKILALPPAEICLVDLT